VNLNKSLLKYAEENDELVLKNIPPQFRKYFSNFLKLNIKEQKYINAIKGNVIFIDDILTEGATIKEAEMLIKSLQPKNLIKYVLIKS
jgi:predicted amidophosphoribosyltransferase